MMSQRDIRSFFGGGKAASKSKSPASHRSNDDCPDGEFHRGAKRRSKRGAPVIESDDEDDAPSCKKSNESRNSAPCLKSPNEKLKSEKEVKELRLVSSESFFGSQIPSRSFKSTNSSAGQRDIENAHEGKSLNNGSSKSKLSLASKLKKKAEEQAGLSHEPISDSCGKSDKADSDKSEQSSDVSIGRKRRIGGGVKKHDPSERSSEESEHLIATDSETKKEDIERNEDRGIVHKKSRLKLVEDKSGDFSSTSVISEENVCEDKNASVEPKNISPKSGSGTPAKPKKKIKAVDEVSPKSSESPRQDSSFVGKQPMEIGMDEPRTPKEKSSVSDKHVLTPEEMHQRKAMNYRRFLERKNSQPVNPGSLEVPEGSPNCLAGITVVITGLLDNIGRDEATQLCKRLGAKVTSAVSRNTNYLVTGSDPGASKTEKAQKLGTKVLNEEGLYDLIRSKTVACDVEAEDQEISRLDESSAHNKKEMHMSSNESKIPNSAPITPKHSGRTHVSSSQEACATAVTDDESASVSSSSTVKQSTDFRLWVDKYRPTSLKAVIGQQGERSVANKLKYWLANWHRFHSGANKVKVRAFTPGFGADDGSNFKAALLSGPPGVGKSTIVQLVCAEMQLASVELNASDSRSKKLLEQYTDCLQTSTLSMGGRGKSFSDRHVLVMDEVDGMAGNQDRGGVAAVIQLLRRSRVPIICMCNDRQHEKVRSLAQYCYDLRVYRPRLEQIRAAMLSVCFKEKFKVSKEALDRLIVGSNQDVRQVLHLLSVMAADSGRRNPTSGAAADGTSSRAVKDLRLGVFDVVMKVFTASARQSMSCDDKLRLFFNDYSLGPLFVQENYLLASPRGNPPLSRRLRLMSEAADALCHADVVDSCVRSTQSWSLLPTYAVFNTLVPGELLAGHLSGRAEFPRWLGKNSSRNKSGRQLSEVYAHACLRVSGGRQAVLLDYAGVLRDHCVAPLLDPPHSCPATSSQDTAAQPAVVEAANRLFSYDLMREDLDLLTEMCCWCGSGKDPLSKLDSRTKAAFTRAVRSGQHSYPYSSSTGTSRVGGGGGAGGLSQMLTEQTDEVDGAYGSGSDSDNTDNNDLTTDKMIKVKPARKSAKQAGESASSKSKKSAKKTAKAK